MEKNYSYAEFMKTVGRNSSSMHAEKMLNDIYMDLFLQHIHRKQIRQRLVEVIDRSLDNNNESEFLKYSAQLLKFEDIN